jgi:integrase/recombinase XerC
MQNTAVQYRKSLSGRRPENRAVAPPPMRPVRDYLLTSEISQRESSWIESCRLRMLSQDTIALRRICLYLLKEFLRDHGYTTCGEVEMRQFFLHLATVGRRDDRSKKLSPSTVKTYHAHLTIFFKFLIAEDILTDSPMARIPTPKWKKVQIQPFTAEQIKALLGATKDGFYPKRDRAIILLLLDTGMRAAELCGIKWGVIDLTGRRITVVGKGDKSRDVYFSSTTYRAIMEYRREETAASGSPTTPLFYSDRGLRTGDCLTESGLLQLIRRIGDRAGLDCVRCSPHTFRHTFALNFLRGGGDAFALRDTLGHEDIKMTQKYVKLAASDVESQNRKFSPVEFMLKKR